MPKVDGFETLKWLREQEGFRTIPVIVLTSSEQVRDVNRAYELGANSFLVTSLDNVGNRSSAGASYSVAYNICPLYAVVAKQSGSAYPIKIRLCDASGNNMSTPSVAVNAVSVTRLSSNTPVTLDDVGDANPDFDFRYDATLAGYILNLSTKGYSTGTYRLDFTAGNDPVVHSALFAVK